MKCLWPQWYFEDISHIPDGFFQAQGIEYLISDIDNTLVSYDDPTPTLEALAFFNRLEKENVKILLVSNNEKERVSLFVGNHPYPWVGKAAKPLTFRMRKMLEKEQVNLKSCAFLGDQIFTDGLTAKFLSVPMILVKPVAGDKGMPFFGVKRKLEKIILKGYPEKQQTNCTKDG